MHGKHIELKNVPLTATTADVRRAIDRTKLLGVKDVTLVYKRFTPTGTAMVSLTRPDFLKKNLQLLENISISGIPLKSRPRLLDDAYMTLPRARGEKGREEADQRGTLNGDGPRAGIRDDGRTVTVWGYPGKTESAAVEFLVRDYDVARKRSGEADVRKVPAPEGRFTMCSRFLVKLANVSEAHRLVREMNMTYYEPETLGNKFILRARIVH
ncbi:hypothetical protein APHAL10511_007054 [Amanita phalloides]|nr:hypothetical protein APHAL10511_007054 [Amanita phalloides]